MVSLAPLLLPLLLLLLLLGSLQISWVHGEVLGGTLV
jgi:hypothetical protein